MAVDMGELAAVIVAGVGVLGPLGALGRFVWNKVERRFEHIEAELEHCRRREHESLERRAVQITVIELLWQEVRTSNPASLVLARAKKLLDGLKPDQAFPLERLTEEFRDLAAKLDSKD